MTTTNSIEATKNTHTDCTRIWRVRRGSKTPFMVDFKILHPIRTGMAPAIYFVVQVASSFLTKQKFMDFDLILFIFFSFHSLSLD